MVAEELAYVGKRAAEDDEVELYDSVDLPLVSD
jgi:hypothetical protein